MAEELVLTDPIVTTETTNSIRITAMMLDSLLLAPGSTAPGVVVIHLRDNLGHPVTHQYKGEAAQEFIRYVNTGNFSQISLHRRTIQKLQVDQVLPPGSMSGQPDKPHGPPAE